MKPALALAFAVVAAGCAGSAGDAPVLERVDLAPAELVVYGEGSLASVTPTSLTVPGSTWSRRQLRWALPDGSWVKADEVVARFAAEQSKLSLATAMIDLQRNALARAGKQGELGDAQGKLTVDLVEVVGALGIAHRFAGMTDAVVERERIIEGVQDEHFLAFKQDTLNWRKDLSTTRGNAELALIDAQRATGDVLARQSRDDLSALEVRAPHEGVVVLQADWSGEKPKVGAIMYAGNVFASLPDTGKMNVEISLPQSEAQGIKEGAVVDLSPLGTPDQKIRSTISWVAPAAATRSRETPVKYLSMKATVPAEAMARYHWVPGQSFRATIFLLQSDKALTVPNIALTNSGDSASVLVRDGARSEARTVRLGVRGPSRTQILDGLKPGETIVIGGAPAALTPSAPAQTAATAPTKAPQ